MRAPSGGSISLARSWAADQSPVASSQSARRAGGKSGGSSPRATDAVKSSSVTGRILRQRPGAGDRGGQSGGQRARQHQHRIAELVGEEAGALGVGGGGCQQVRAREGGQELEVALVRGVGAREDSVDDARAEGGRDAQVGLAAAGADDVRGAAVVLLSGAFERADDGGPDGHHPPVTGARLG